MGERVRWLVIVLLVVLSVTGGWFTAAGQGSKNILTIAHTVDAIQGLDPHQTGMRESRIITQQIFEYLVTPTPAQVRPGLAVSWASSPEGNVWTFTLRAGAKFHDGTPADAAAVRLNFERVVRLGPRATALVNLAANFDRAEVLSPTQVRVYLKRPSASFLNLLGEYFAIVSPAAADKFGDDFSRNPVGSGPFVFRSWAQKERVVLVRNPEYRGGPEFVGNSGPARLDEVVYRVIPEAATLTEAFQRGEAQILDFVAPTDVARLRSLGAKFETIIQITPGVVSSYNFNTERTPTDDVSVRRAIALAINKRELEQSAALGGIVPTVHSYLSRTNWAYSSKVENQRLNQYDPERGQRLLDEAGWRVGPDGIRVKDGRPLRLLILSLSNLPIQSSTDLIIQSQLRQVGIVAEINSVEIAGYLAGMNRGNFNMVLNSASGYDPDASMVRVFHSGGGTNFARYRNPQVDQLLGQAAVEMNVEKRRATYTQVQEVLAKDLPTFPMYPFTGIVLKRPEVSGVWFDPRVQYKLINAQITAK